MNVTLRPAAVDDGYGLWLWANDEAARAASGNRAPIEWPSHRAWLADRLGSPHALVLIAESPARQPLGTIRFESADGWATARVSYGVAPESRGRGIGRALLGAGPAALAPSQARARLFAMVQPGNSVSRHLFATLGWVEEGSTPTLLRYVRSGRASS